MNGDSYCDSLIFFWLVLLKFLMSEAILKQYSQFCCFNGVFLGSKNTAEEAG